VALGRRSAELVVVDFLGRILREWDSTADLTAVRYMSDLLLQAAEQMLLTLTADQTARLQGVGIAVPADFGSDDDRGRIHKGSGREAYDLLDRLSAIGQRFDIPVHVQNEAIAACSSELVYGHGRSIPNFVYLHVADIIDGGIVQLGSLQFAPRPWPAGMGRMLVPGPGGRLMPLARLPVPNWSDTIDLVDRRTVQGQPTSPDQSIADLALGLSHALHAASAIAQSRLALSMVQCRRLSDARSFKL
jgi:predicted NBD/HSP70 family sugar kinase